MTSARPRDLAEAAHPSPQTIQDAFATPPCGVAAESCNRWPGARGGYPGRRLGSCRRRRALASAGWHALATLIAVVPLFALDALPEGIVALLLGAAWVIGGVASPTVALSGFTSSSWVLVVSVLAVGGAIASTGLLYRLALWAVTHTGGGFVGQALSLAVVGLAVGPAIPNATARITLFAPAVSELAEVLRYRAGSRAAAGLAMAVHSGFGQMTAAFLTSSTTALLVYAVLPESVAGLTHLDELGHAHRADHADPVRQPAGGHHRAVPATPGSITLRTMGVTPPVRIGSRLLIAVWAALRSSGRCSGRRPVPRRRPGR